MHLGTRTRRWIAGLAIALAALLAVAWFARNAIAASVVRSVGTRMLGVPVSVDAVRLDVFGLAVELDGLAIDNPPGWGAPRLLEADRISVAVSGESSSSRLVVDSVRLKGVRIWFVLDGIKSNVSAVIDNLPRGDAGGSKPADGAQRMDLLIRLLALEDVTVRCAERHAASADSPVLVSLGRVEVRDIDARTAGSRLAEQLFGQVLESTMMAVLRESGSKLPAALGQGITESIKMGGRLGQEAVDALGGAARQAGDAVGGFLKGIGDAIGGTKK